jgi:hypothetical protein
MHCSGQVRIDRGAVSEEQIPEINMALPTQKVGRCEMMTCINGLMSQKLCVSLRQPRLSKASKTGEMMARDTDQETSALAVPQARLHVDIQSTYRSASDQRGH